MYSLAVLVIIWVIMMVIYIVVNALAPDYLNKIAYEYDIFLIIMLIIGVICLLIPGILILFILFLAIQNESYQK